MALGEDRYGADQADALSPAEYNKVTWRAVPDWLREERKAGHLSSTDLEVWLAIAKLGRGWPRRLSYEQIAQEAGYSARHVSRSIPKLDGCGALYVDGESWRASRYDVRAAWDTALEEAEATEAEGTTDLSTLPGEGTTDPSTLPGQIRPPSPGRIGPPPHDRSVLQPIETSSIPERDLLRQVGQARREEGVNPEVVIEEVSNGSPLNGNGRRGELTRVLGGDPL